MYAFLLAFTAQWDFICYEQKKSQNRENASLAVKQKHELFHFHAHKYLSWNSQVSVKKLTQYI